MLGKTLLVLSAASLAAIPAAADAKHRGKKHHHGYSKSYKKHVRAYYGSRYYGDRYYSRRYVAYPRYYGSRYYGGYYGNPYYGSTYAYPYYGSYYGSPYYGSTIYIGRRFSGRYRHR